MSSLGTQLFAARARGGQGLMHDNLVLLAIEASRYYKLTKRKQRGWNDGDAWIIYTLVLGACIQQLASNISIYLSDISLCRGPLFTHVNEGIHWSMPPWPKGSIRCMHAKP